MYRDSREFSGFGVELGASVDLRKIATLLPPSDMEVESLTDFDGSRMAHLLFYSPDRYTRQDNLEETRVMRKGLSVYRYNVLVLQLSSNECLLAAPFAALAAELGRRLVRRVTRAGIEYAFQRPDLDAVRKAISEGRDAKGSVSLRELDFQVLGDERVERLAFRGVDLVNADTYQEVLRIAGRLGISLDLRRFRVRYRSPDDSYFAGFGLGSDAWGNYRFRVASGWTNIGNCFRLFSFLKQEELLRNSDVFPPSRDKGDDSRVVEK